MTTSQTMNLLNDAPGIMLRSKLKGWVTGAVPMGKPPSSPAEIVADGIRRGLVKEAVTKPVKSQHAHLCGLSPQEYALRYQRWMRSKPGFLEAKAKRMAESRKRTREQEERAAQT